MESLAQRPSQEDAGSISGNESDKVALLCDVTNQVWPLILLCLCHARVAPFCDSALSRESVKRACVSALLRVDGSLFYNV